MRIAICDNNLKFRKEMTTLLESWAEDHPGTEIGTFCSAGSLIKSHARKAFDVIMLDPVTPEPGGMEAARKIRASDKLVKLVFIASSADCAVESYAVKASNYLLKPVDQTTLLQCLDEIEIELLALGRRISFKCVHSVRSIDISSIEYIRAHRKHASIALLDGTIIETNEPFYSFENKLFMEEGFFKCRRGCIVNINHASAFDSGTITMKSGAVFPISRGCARDYKKTRFSTLLKDVDDELSGQY